MGFSIRVNPYPILPYHLTISSEEHIPQILADKTDKQLPLRIINEIEKYFGKGYALFYNGAKCGASAPDHFHFQAARQKDIPFIKDWKRIFKSATEVSNRVINDHDICREYTVDEYVSPIHVFTSMSGIIDEELVNSYLDSLYKEDEEPEPRYNLFAWRNDDGLFTVAYFPRSEHRPSCFYESGEKQILVSPGALDMSGIIVTPREEDFRKIGEQDIRRIFKEVSL